MCEPPRPVSDPNGEMLPTNSKAFSPESNLEARDKSLPIRTGSPSAQTHRGYSTRIL